MCNCATAKVAGSTNWNEKKKSVINWIFQGTYISYVLICQLNRLRTRWTFGKCSVDYSFQCSTPLYQPLIFILTSLSNLSLWKIRSVYKIVNQNSLKIQIQTNDLVSTLSKKQSRRSTQNDYRFTVEIANSNKEMT